MDLDHRTVITAVTLVSVYDVVHNTTSDASTQQRDPPNRSQPGGYPVPLSQGDEFLDMVLDAAFETGGSLKLTLFYGGLAIIGTVVPDEVFFERLDLSSLAASAQRDREENKRLLAAVYESTRDNDTPIEEHFRMLERASALKRQFIMMVDVTILGAGPDPITAPAWRGRLDHISGWVLGVPDEPQGMDE